MVDIGHLYIFPLAIGIIYLLIRLLLSQSLGRKTPFNNDYTNLFYNLADVAPFKWFVEENPKHIKALTMNHLIKEAKMEKVLDYRSATAMQIALFFMGITGFVLINLALTPLINIFSFLLNLDAYGLLSDQTTMNMIRIGIVMVLLIPALLIKPYLKKRAKNNEIDFIKDLPLLQLFIILMLRSNRTINEVMYVLSTTKSTYQPTFQRAYLVYLRDPHEAFDFLEEIFDGTLIIETVFTLRDYSEYDKEESIRTLENNQEEIEEFTKQARKQAEAGRNLMATVSMAFPFLAVLALGAAPLAYWALGLISNGM